MEEAEEVQIFRVSGYTLKVCMKETWYGPNPGWMQYDDDVNVNDEGNIVSIGGFPLNENMIYRVGSFADFYIDHGHNPTLANYFKENPTILPDHNDGIGCHALLLKH